jgi:transposase
MRWTPPAGAIRHQCTKLYAVHQLVPTRGVLHGCYDCRYRPGKDVFEIALADERGHIVERQRLSRARFDRFFANRSACRIVMEACGSAHHHARRLSSQGHDVVLLPAQYARAYVRRNKTDAADAAALIEASRCPDIRPVPIKSLDRQALQQLHRLRSQWMGARTSRINFLRACLREFGVCVRIGALRAIESALAAPSSLHVQRNGRRRG